MTQVLSQGTSQIIWNDMERAESIRGAFISPCLGSAPELRFIFGVLTLPPGFSVDFLPGVLAAVSLRTAS